MTAWRPHVKGIEEVFHARFVDHAYPQHTHDAWTLLIVDTGTIRYGLDRHEHGSTDHDVTLLPPHVPHDGRTVTASGFRKRVLYIEADLLTGIGAAVDNPTLRDPLLRGRVDQLHAALRPGDEYRGGKPARVHRRTDPGTLAACPAMPRRMRDRRLARELRNLRRAHRTGLTLDQARAVLHADPAHLVRTFTREFGMPPHKYLTGRRIELARRLLLDGMRPADVAVSVGFHDQSHLNRHFKRMLATTPARYADGRNRVG